MPPDRYRDFVFTPAELAEEADLPLELKKEILYLDARLGELDGWQLLGLPWNAPCEAARRAYLERAKLFHPDRYAGRRLGSYLRRIERIFRAVTEARDLLVNEARRAAYARKTAPPEEFARMEMRKLSDEGRAKERQARLARSNTLVQHATRIRDLVERGRQLMAEGKYQQAANDFLTALGLDPRHSEARGLAEEAKRGAAVNRSREIYERALSAEAMGQDAAARVAYREAAEADPENPRHAIAASRAALEEGELAQARALAERAIRLAPRDARAFANLGQVLHAQGEAREARRAVERALELDPGLETGKALLKKLRWSFLG